MITRKNLGIDMDETLCVEVCWTPEDCLKATPKKEFIDKVNQLYNHNFIVIYTARKDFLLEATLEWMRRNNVRWHAISNIKIPLDVYVDDKALCDLDIDSLLDIK